MGAAMQPPRSALPTADAIVRFHDAALPCRHDSDGDVDGDGAGARDGARDGDAIDCDARRSTNTDTDTDTDDIWRAIKANHRHNGALWREEDRARRTDVGADAIATSKRLIDRHNQLRNDAVEAIDEALLARLPAESAPPGIGDAPAPRLSSETAGAMIDRLSIMALKIFHMRAQAYRAEAGAAHVATCAARLQRLVAQRNDLAGCLDRLLNEAASGTACFRIYRQFKMYNDPALNPWLYAPSTDASATDDTHSGGVP